MDVEELDAERNEEVAAAVTTPSGPGSSVAKDVGEARFKEEVVVASSHPKLIAE